VELAAIRAAIRSAGLRFTAPRIAVLDLLQRIPVPAPRGDLAAALPPLGFDGATVYRNLRDLTAVAMVACVDLGDHVRRYELRRPGAAHPYFVCTTCGGISRLTGANVELTFAPGARRRLPVADVAQVVIRGTCTKCSARPARAKADPRDGPRARWRRARTRWEAG
jgi:Fur family ferric uptake transcriptional regulator